MNILFDEDGGFRAGSLMADNNSSLQVELPSGKRSKVKAANVLLRFNAPTAAELLPRAETAGTEIDLDFLWEVCPEDEFGFEELAAEYFGTKPDAVQSTTLLLRLHGAPMYFHRKGRGRYRKAPADILQAAKAGLEKKRLAQLAVERMCAQLVAGEAPPEFAAVREMLLYAPDRNRNETKALEAACAASGRSAAALFHACGLLASSHNFHFGRFLHEYFPSGQGGTKFPEFAVPSAPTFDTVADVAAFSIDDAATTEIDDAFSVTPRAAGGWRIGIHIAAPGLAFGPDSDLGQIARRRLSTVYMPGNKLTMLPPEVVEHYTLAAGRTVPALSLYIDVAPDLQISAHESRIEAVPIVANLRHHDIEPVFNAETLAQGLGKFPYRDELKLLYELATVLEAARSDPNRRGGQRKDYSYEVDWDARHTATADEAGVVTISERPRGSPLDTLVAELMIVANSTWGALLRDAGIPALYRAQSMGRVRMTTVAAPHDGLGVDCYAWSSSPLRRYCDLLNQWQLIAHLRGEAAPFRAKSAELHAALRDFDATYTAYADFQRQMERYWCLRWLLQQAPRREFNGRIIKEQLVRLDEVPLVIRMLDLPALDIAGPGRAVKIALEHIDLLEAQIQVRFVELLAGSAELDEEELLDEEAAEVEAEPPATAEMPSDLGPDAVIPPAAGDSAAD
jgi:exoribonuclease-2